MKERKKWTNNFLSQVMIMVSLRMLQSFAKLQYFTISTEIEEVCKKIYRFPMQRSFSQPQQMISVLKSFIYVLSFAIHKVNSESVRVVYKSAAIYCLHFRQFTFRHRINSSSDLSRNRQVICIKAFLTSRQWFKCSSYKLQTMNANKRTLNFIRNEIILTTFDCRKHPQVCHHQSLLNNKQCRSYFSIVFSRL